MENPYQLQPLGWSSPASSPLRLRRSSGTIQGYIYEPYGIGISQLYLSNVFDRNFRFSGIILVERNFCQRGDIGREPIKFFDSRDICIFCLN